MVRLWRLAAPGMGTGHLPEPGGSLDQAALMMDAFAAMTAAERELEEKRKDADRDRHRGQA